MHIWLKSAEEKYCLMNLVKVLKYSAQVLVVMYVKNKIGQLVDRRIELSILIKAIDELGKMGEVKVTEWIRGGQTAWMKNIPRSKATAYGASPTGLSKEWWRRFICQCSAAGYIMQLISYVLKSLGSSTKKHKRG